MTRKEHCAKMRKGKAERRMLSQGEIKSREVGFAFFCGPAFRGCHVFQLMAVSDGRKQLDIVIDGSLAGCRTERGIKSLIARRISARCGYGRKRSESALRALRASA
jgi:hypothetical protein